MNPEGTILDPTNRLRLATRIHFSLMRQFDEVVEVRDLLDGSTDGKEALWVCEASGDTELIALAQEFRRATRRVLAAAPRSAAPAVTVEAQPPAGRVPQDTSWAQDTSGFGLSQPAELTPRPRADASPSWFAPMGWLRRGATR
jgi:hypothetical protein